MNPLNLSEFTVLKSEENEKDYRFTVEKKEIPVACPECNSNKLHVHGIRERLVRDMNMHGRRVGILIRHKRYKCAKCNKTFMEPLECIEEDSKMTIRLFQHLRELAAKRTFADVAKEYAVSETTVKRAFESRMSVLNSISHKIETPRILGIDEVHIDHDMRAVFCDCGKRAFAGNARKA